LAIAQAVGVKVLTSHGGVIRDFDGLLIDFRENHKKQ
jgi:hypothetical protein